MTSVGFGQWNTQIFLHRRPIEDAKKKLNLIYLIKLTQNLLLELLFGDILYEKLFSYCYYTIYIISQRNVTSL